MKTLRFLALLIVISLSGITLGIAKPNTWNVPEDFGSIQLAVDNALVLSGDQIRVGPGEWCGATVTKTLNLFGEGDATIIGCTGSPTLAGVLRIGFFLPNAAASGTTIRHFVFDGLGTSNANLDPLSFAVFARDASDVTLEQNTILGTIQAITNTRGSGWTVNHNKIVDFSVLACEPAGFCGGGVGIVFQDRNTAGPRQTDNSAMFNEISGVIPDDFDVFSMAGILVLGAQDGNIIQKNRITVPDNPTSLAEGQAVVVTDVCCGLPTPFSTAINSTIAKNDGRDSEFSVVITLDSGGGTGNTAGTTLRGNFGVNDINAAITEVSNRSIKTLVEFP